MDKKLFKLIKKLKDKHSLTKKEYRYLIENRTEQAAKAYWEKIKK